MRVLGTSPDRAEQQQQGPGSTASSRRAGIYKSLLGNGRRPIAVLGLCLVAPAEYLRPSTAQSMLADAGIVALVFAAIWLLLEGRGQTRGSGVSTPGAVKIGPGSSGQLGRVSTWRWTMVGLSVFGGLLCQSWFKAGTAIAGGDIAPPIGTAWIGNVFSPYAWPGDLGAPGQLEGNLPWAAVDWLVHGLGGSGALAQRLWLSLLVAGVIMAVAALLRSLGVSPLAGAIGAIFYLLNPFTLSDVGINDVWLMAMVLLPALGAVVIAYAKGSFTLGQASVALVVAAPFLGFTYANPPLVGMLAGAFVLSPLLARLHLGRLGGRRALHVVVVGGFVLIAASAYWIIPAKIALADVASGTLSSISSWGFTELRSTIANGLWLNDTWGWHYAIYYPYAAQFARFPLVLVRVLVPVAAFSVLTVAKPRQRGLARISGALALVALAVVFLSTGTRFPGNLIFDPLYHLPYGWLLQIPGRFLMVSALCYAVLLACLVEDLRSRDRAKPSAASRNPPYRPSTIPRAATFASLGIVAVALVSSYPIWTGSVISGPHAGFPSTHVRVPRYWTDTAAYMNGHGPGGSMLVLPPDDFYAMPYTWYYGNDGFIVNLFKRHVVDPSGQSYDKVSTELLQATNLEASELVSHNFGEARRILAAIGTPVVMVRGDIEPHFARRHIVSPRSLVSSLNADPEMRLVYRNGPLSIYGVARPLRQPTGFATTTSAQPDLLALSLLPRATALVRSLPVAGHTALYQVPAARTWQVEGSLLTTAVVERPGWAYSAVVLGARGPSPPARHGVSATTAHRPGGGKELQLSLALGGDLLRNGNFAHGLWQKQVGNCNAALPTPPGALAAKVLAHGGPSGERALELSATMDGACDAKALRWAHGSLFLRMATRSLSSPTPPKICLWEEPEATCAKLPAVKPSAHWRTYSAVVSPPAGTKGLMLFVYAMPVAPGTTSTELYAGIDVRAIAGNPRIEVVAQPTEVRPEPRLITIPEGYAAGWKAFGAGRHVEVDGMRNGWLTTDAAGRDVRIVFTPVASEVRDEAVVGTGSLLIALLAAVLWSAECRDRIRRTKIHVSRHLRRTSGRRAL